MNGKFFAVGIVSLIPIACETGKSTYVSSGDFNPLRAPGSNLATKPSQNSAFAVGAITKASMDNTAFYLKRPSGAADADKLLSKGTSVKVISEADGYVKVELDKTGEIGWVLAVQLDNPNAAAAGFPADAGGVPVGVTEPLPIPDPAGLPPGGAIPPVLDPANPGATPPSEIKVDPVKENFDTPKPPVEPKDAANGVGTAQ